MRKKPLPWLWPHCVRSHLPQRVVPSCKALPIDVASCARIRKPNLLRLSPRARYVGVRHVGTCRGRGERQGHMQPEPGEHPFGWIYSRLTLEGDPLLGEEPVDRTSLGLSGETEIFHCKCCGEVLARVPVEFLRDGFEEITINRIAPILALHFNRCR